MLMEKDFIDLLNKNQRIIYKICNLYMDNAVDKEDLFQEITLQAWKSFGSFRGNAQFSTWLYRIALNTAITFFRKEKRKIPVLNTETLPELTDEQNDIENRIKAMYQAIGDLSKIDKALVMLYLEDYSYIEIGDILGITPNNVAVKMNRIKLKLKEQTQKHYQF